MSNIVSQLDGISGELAGTQYGLKATLLFFISISIYNVIELAILVLSTFRRWTGLYFWSLLLSGCLGVIPYSLGFMLKFFTHANSFLSVTLLTVGWWTMVTGQSIVLYSRLHLVIRDERILRRVLCMIIANFFLLHVPTSVLTYGSNVPDRSPLFVKGYNIMEKIQMTGFTLQEVIISGLYIWETTKLLRLGSSRQNRRIMRQLVGINVAILVMDLALLALEYASFYAIQITLKGVIYSIKLKLEFAVLGKLVDMVHGHRHPGTFGNDVQWYSLEYESSPTAPASSSDLLGRISFSRVVQDGTKRPHSSQSDGCPDKKFTMKVSDLVKRRPPEEII
ncbi:hypothetical protein BDV32DRAFT_939 [Aspergillus pseudonomiae]|uniref:DUF7703 domain-containing protein n=1 Tax=Aspergillus pseudonomiae TaxID=1506151 RepID=A0A5N6IJM9_9EURO|nr:uncharacterized protein BDV37DRAFT_138359 [Aspergillus pseudonomiae]KAB8266090.1 hypothetical protein BDV32DRAFT_939 [Aspergillus pseudonomiae]KAE8408958.1 hypothetical protein BDV37DRAFT_138359 [Aspergillus pseudonomiae]